jgi:hypothetical protein
MGDTRTKTEAIAASSSWRTIKLRTGLIEEIEYLINNSKVIADVPKYRSISDFVSEGATRLLQQEKRRMVIMK